MLLLVPRQEMLSRYLARVEGGWGEGVSPSPFIKIYERGRGDPFTPASSPLLPCSGLFAGLSVQFDLNVHTRRQLQLHERVHGLIRGVQYVHQALVRADFELIARILVAVRRRQHRKTLHLDGQRHGTLDGRAGALRGIDDFARRLVDQAMIESLQSNSNVLISHDLPSRFAPTITGVDATPNHHAIPMRFAQIPMRFAQIPM